MNWKQLRHKAIEAAAGAYAPYSGFPVGAAALVDDGRIVAGCNVENVSYGLGLCAECAVVCALHSGGGGRLVALSCVAADGAPLMPCGRCRQVLLEHGGPQMLIDPRRLTIARSVRECYRCRRGEHVRPQVIWSRCGWP
ncbi:cytidine deaminase [Mycolicibacterium moriokaense]|nr:cytidine deaminase [Mycolicibacterium moriokaense]